MFEQQYYPAQTPGMFYPSPPPAAKNTQPLTAEQIAKLRQTDNSVDLRLTQEEIWKAACTHKEKNGSSALIQNSDGSWTCTICHATFNMVEETEQGVEDIIKRFSDIFQTMKTIYLDISPDFILQYSQAYAMLTKFQTLWKLAVSNFARYDNYLPNGQPVYPGYAGQNAFAAYGNLVYNPQWYQNPQPMAAPVPAQPNQPMYYPQQQVTPAPMYQNNPLAYGTPSGAPVMAQPNQPIAPAPPAAAIPAMPAVPQAPVMMNPGIVQDANGTQQPVQNAQAAQNNEVQQQQSFNV